ncbi:hypothetical protein ANO14919_001690 [Xylariales sp. No.14919]|nr:hypothetical protein ANO14919_001690 [Xylariales sp. No.14919]
MKHGRTQNKHERQRLGSCISHDFPSTAQAAGVWRHPIHPKGAGCLNGDGAVGIMLCATLEAELKLCTSIVQTCAVFNGGPLPAHGRRHAMVVTIERHCGWNFELG